MTVHGRQSGGAPFERRLLFAYSFAFLKRVFLHKYSHGTYFCRKDAQGYIIAILDSNGSVVVRYVYDAWGNHAVLDANGADISDANHIGILNPFRYRGYFYDVETGLYYLQTRYYDPETGRFITIDGIEYLDPETINGLNLYAYCGNNPVMRTDSQGTNWWTDFWNGIGGAIFKILGGIVLIGALAVGSIFTGGLLSVVLAGAAIGAIGGAIGGGISGIISGGGLQGFANGFLVGAATGAVSGAVAASPLGIGLQIGINAVLGVLNYSMVSRLNGQDITLGGLITSGILGAIGGLLGGSGWMNGAGVKDLLRLDVVKNFLKYALSYAGKTWTIKTAINAFLVSGISGGFYGKISSWLNPGGSFIGW